MPYQIHKKISSDAYFDYYIGRIEGQRDFKRVCIVKFLKDRYQADMNQVDRLAEEAATNARLLHKGILQVYELLEIEGRYGLAMDYEPSVTLHELMAELKSRNTRLPPEFGIHICAEIADALHFAHSVTDPVTKEKLRFIHCAISPANILLTENGEIKLMNFSESLSNLKYSESTTTSISLKFNYVSPEQRYGVKLSHSTDIYSLGVVLWECLAGRPRFEDFELSTHGDNDELDPELPRLSELIEGFDPELDEIVARATMVSPGDRFLTGAAFSKVLRTYLKKFPQELQPNKFKSFLQRAMNDRLKVCHQDIQASLVTPFRENFSSKIINFDGREIKTKSESHIYSKGRDLVLANSASNEIKLSATPRPKNQKQHQSYITQVQQKKPQANRATVKLYFVVFLITSVLGAGLYLSRNERQLQILLRSLLD